MRKTPLQVISKRNAVLRRAIRTKNKRKLAALIALPSVVLGVTIQGSMLSSDGRRNRIFKPRKLFSFQDHVESLEPQFFRRLYRVSVAQFQNLCEYVTPYLRKHVTREAGTANTASIEVHLCITLRMLAGASYLDVGWPYGIGSATVYTIFQQTLQALNSSLPKMSFPTTEEECRYCANQFRKLRKSPIDGIVAALDGIAIAIQQPRLDQTPDPRKYYNRKGFYSVCVQAAVGANYKFLFVSARHAGGIHDSTAFQASVLFEALRLKKLPSWARIAADDAYKNGGYILTPYGGPNLSNIKDSFNYYLSSCRITIEQAFGMLVSRFGIFWSPLRFSLATNTLIIMVACKLHNFIIDSRDDTYYNQLDIAEDNNVQGSPTVYIQDYLHTEQDLQRSRNRQREDSSIRDEIASELNVLGLLRPRVRR